jgi:hypothetical protein
MSAGFVPRVKPASRGTKSFHYPMLGSPAVSMAVAPAIWRTRKLEIESYIVSSHNHALHSNFAWLGIPCILPFVEGILGHSMFHPACNVIFVMQATAALLMFTQCKGWSELANSFGIQPPTRTCRRLSGGDESSFCCLLRFPSFDFSFWHGLTWQGHCIATQLVVVVQSLRQFWKKYWLWRSWGLTIWGCGTHLVEDYPHMQFGYISSL